MGDEDGNGIGDGNYLSWLGYGCGDGDLSGNKTWLFSGTGDGYEGDQTGDGRRDEQVSGCGSAY